MQLWPKSFPERAFHTGFHGTPYRANCKVFILSQRNSQKPNTNFRHIAFFSILLKRELELSESVTHSAINSKRPWSLYHLRALEHISHERKHLDFFCSLQIVQHLVQCLQFNTCLINTCWVNEQTPFISQMRKLEPKQSNDLTKVTQ